MKRIALALVVLPLVACGDVRGHSGGSPSTPERKTVTVYADCYAAATTWNELPAKEQGPSFDAWAASHGISTVC